MSDSLILFLQQICLLTLASELLKKTLRNVVAYYYEQKQASQLKLFKETEHDA